MLLKFPKLLRKQYLNYSPLWKTYLEGDTVNPQSFKINTKLFSAFTISQIINCQLNTQINKSKQIKEIIDQFNQYYRQVKQIKQKRGDIDQPLQRVNQFLQISNLMKVDSNKYLEQLNKIYKNMLLNLIQQERNEENKLQQKKQQSNFLSNPIYSKIPQYIHKFVNVSRTIGIDDIDLLIFKSIPLKSIYLTALVDSKLQWNVENLLTLKLFKQIVIDQIAKGTYDSIAGLKVLINRFVNALSSNNSAQRQPIDVFINSLNSLISSGKLMKDIDIQTMRQLFKQKIDKSNSLYRIRMTNKQNKVSQSANRSYLQILAHEYLLYMNWLCMKCLYRPASGSFIVNLQEFCQKINYCTLSDLIKAEVKKKKPNSTTYNQDIKQLGSLILSQQLCKLQIITYLYNQITQTTGLKTNKLREFSKEEIGMQIITKLRSIKIEKEKLCQKLCDIDIIDKYNGTKNGFNIQNIGLCLKSISYVIQFMNINKQNSDLNLNISIKSDIILKVAEKYIQQLIKFDVILLNQQQMQDAHRVISMIIQQSSASNKIVQYHKKLKKYIKTSNQAKTVVSKSLNPQILITSVYESKILWESLKNNNPTRKNIDYSPADLEQVRQSLFLLTSKSKQLKKNKTNENFQDKNDQVLAQKEKKIARETNANTTSSTGQKKRLTVNYFFN